MPPPNLVGSTQSPFFSLQDVFGVYVSGFGSCRTLLDSSLIHLVVSVLLQLKHTLGLAEQASTFERARSCSEGKIRHMHVSCSGLSAVSLLD